MATASYLEQPVPKKTAGNGNRTKSLLSLFLALMILAGNLTFLGNNIAYAETDPKNIVDEAASTAGYDNPDDEGFMNMLDEAQANGRNNDRDTFLGLVYRLMIDNYINYTPSAFNPETGEIGVPNDGWNCNKDHKWKGTPLYHNCDIPNFGTELYQYFIDLFFPSGMVFAERTSSKSSLGIGVPSRLPAGADGKKEVPVAISERAEKYTGLELYGYGMKYTTYKGEWDNIKVDSEVRMLRNFTTSENFRLAYQATVKAVQASANAAGSRVGELVEQKGWFGVLLSPIGSTLEVLGAAIEAGASSGINTIVDTSDYNIFNNYGWSRYRYAETLYNARQITPDEKSILIQAMMLKMLEVDESELIASVPQELLNMEKGPTRPVKPVPKCEYVGFDNPDAEKPTPKTPIEVRDENGVQPATAKACRDLVIKNYSDAPDYHENLAFYVFDPAGTQANDWDLQVWREKPEIFDYLSEAASYDLSCEINTETNNSLETWETNVTAFYDCWSQAFTNAKVVQLNKAQEVVDKDWIENASQSETVAETLRNNPAYNFNAPWNQYVCVDGEGNDIVPSGEGRGGLKLTFLYNPDGTLNTNDCQAVRPPIQNGILGNGYVTEGSPITNGKTTPGGAPGVDTRWGALTTTSAVEMLFHPNSSTTDPVGFANVLFNISGLFVAVANFFIDLSFSPIMSQLGMDTVLISFMESFVDSLFMPLVVMFIALAGLYIMWKAISGMQLMSAFKNMLTLFLVFMIGTILLTNPERVFRFVDETPTQFEAAVVAMIFGDSGDKTKVCSTAPAGEGAVEGLDGSMLNFNVDHTVRALQCQVWKALLFEPWVEGQWGTNYDNLYTKDFSNSNRELVGDASVNMGGNVIENNWALYQLDLMKSGTITTVDRNELSGEVDQDFYKLVDLQAGPAEGSPMTNGSTGKHDGKYFDTWASDSLGKNIISAMGLVVSVIASITIISYSIVKIQVTLLSLLLITLLPIMLLFGLHPRGTVKLREYAGNIAALMIQRVLITLLMAMMLKLISEFSDAAANSTIRAMFLIVLCFMFFKSRKELLNTFMGRNGNGDMQVLSTVKNSISRVTPKGVKQYGRNVKMAASGYVGGTVGGFVAGGITGAIDGAKEAAAIQSSSAVRKNMREGRTILGQNADTRRRVVSNIRKNEALTEQIDKARNRVKSRNEEIAEQVRKRQMENTEVVEEIEEVAPDKKQETQFNEQNSVPNENTEHEGYNETRETEETTRISDSSEQTVPFETANTMNSNVDANEPTEIIQAPKETVDRTPVETERYETPVAPVSLNAERRFKPKMGVIRKRSFNKKLVEYDRLSERYSELEKEREKRLEGVLRFENEMSKNGENEGNSKSLDPHMDTVAETKRINDKFNAEYGEELQQIESEMNAIINDLNDDKYLESQKTANRRLKKELKEKERIENAYDNMHVPIIAKAQIRRKEQKRMKDLGVEYELTDEQIKKQYINQQYDKMVRHEERKEAYRSGTAAIRRYRTKQRHEQIANDVFNTGMTFDEIKANLAGFGDDMFLREKFMERSRREKDAEKQDRQKELDLTVDELAKSSELDIDNEGNYVMKFQNGRKATFIEGKISEELMDEVDDGETEGEKNEK